MRKTVFPLLLLASLTLNSCGELQQVINSTTSNTGFNVADGLKQALEFGVSNGVDILSKDGGYFKDQAVRILLPDELKKVDSALRNIGLGSLADEGLKILNKAAENAVNEAKPIFISAIKNMTFDDAMRILKGDSQAATTYLKNNTFPALQAAFAPKIQASLSQVGADKIWSDIINQYNQIPFVKKVEPNLTSYVTTQAINGLFVKVGDKEKEIRTNISARTTSLLKSVFALQD
ncbi:DUF4197 domain-containing protein [Capnocytophaga felis]|uniref:DUF4197 domain-containing protein n=1 Tax=Capnocytophaga felis TaxID=2267611 RepID=A0A5M4B8U7_9FLAO|nr:DUF4197 domain-containing protein [Capnocytophaga felis]GET46034.1 hypothetical protein RCZ01_13360 [Capnocytophaga felis]GET49114.1 hypothetical protein RCZ02_19450 [Capnocytophaga felis]